MANRNAFIGLSDAHVATLTDETNFTYGDPLDVGALGGIIEIALEIDSQTDTIYASDQPWIDSETDNGFTGTMRLVDVWSQPVLRRAFAEYVGYEFAADGTLLGTSGKPRKKFALMAGQSGVLSGKRTCYLSVQVQKPAKNAATKEASGVHQADEFPIVARPVTLPSGWKGSFYENVEADGSLYTNFFSSVRTDLVASSSSAEYEDLTLTALTLGTATLVPSFGRNVVNYTLTTTESTIPVTAVASDSGATIAIVNGEDAVTNGGSATLASGTNTIKVTVSKSGQSKVYTVVVTKSA